ncbi:GNAT family N-acetyltransferase [Comamonas sp. 17RB]|uniref:GNAT family N-acetyltransferase n=1 Tax=Comamonas sp. 17RB TaxID=3047025 RepID=UPI0024B77C9C|nr:GNAT family N-acetyltransferase [Comamonas sp. 17RB]MDI9853614.1 GNAT family N-acetyltransferase [Comamonas sp. 17RB]
MDAFVTAAGAPPVPGVPAGPDGSLPLVAAPGTASVARLEQRSFNAWPAVRTAVMDGWLLRSSGGYTKRANSANAVQAGALLDEGLLQAIEAWYARQQLPAIFRLSPLADAPCDALLAARGYALVEPSRFLLRHGTPADCQLPAVPVEPRCTPAWLAGYAQASGLAPQQQPWHQRIVDGIGGQCAYATVEQGGRSVAWGLAVLERRAAGLYDVVVAPECRGQGLGRQLVRGLLQWAAAQGAQQLDLQVRGGNRVAEQLYASLGFVPVYGYHYRVQR